MTSISATAAAIATLGRAAAAATDESASTAVRRVMEVSTINPW
jgi:hypothetical protein